MGSGTLYVVATPIGNLSDISFRALEVLKEVNLIAAEDTRHTKKLLNHYDIHTSLISYHQHNAVERGALLVTKLREGQNIAIVTDAGMPGISDPGYILIKEAVASGFEVSPIPGASASLASLVVSGLPTERFVFEGFLPRKKEEARHKLEEMSTESRTIIFYEAPHRLKKTLALCVQCLGADRPAAIARELTKKYEEILRGSLKELADAMDNREVKGEICLVVGGEASTKSDDAAEWWENISPVEHVNLLISRGFTVADAIKETAKQRQISKRELYAKYHQ